MGILQYCTALFVLKSTKEFEYLRYNTQTIFYFIPLIQSNANINAALLTAQSSTQILVKPDHYLPVITRLWYERTATAIL